MLVGRAIVIGAGLLILIFPVRWLLHRCVRAALRVRSDQPSLVEKTLLRFETLGFYQWMFAVLKTRLDPMFIELPWLLHEAPSIKNFLDLGCGFGIAGSFLLELFPDAIASGIDPSEARVAGASAAFGDRGKAFKGAAPDFESPGLPDHFDAVFVLDVIHFLSDEQLHVTLQRISAWLNPGHWLVIRANILPQGRGSVPWHCYAMYRLITGVPGYFRTVERTGELIGKAGYNVMQTKISGKNPELHWFICTPASAALSPETTSTTSVN